LLHIDSMYEFEYLQQLLNEKKINEAKIGVRINFNILSYKSRFGFNVENGELEKIVNAIKSDSRIKLISIHSHFSTREKSLEIFSLRTKKMCEIYKNLKHQHNIQYIDIGGGFFGEMPLELAKKFNVSIPSFRQYSRTIVEAFLEELAGFELPTLIVEPGISIVGNTMTYVTKVLEIKKANNISYAVCDSSINIVNPTKSLVSPMYKVVSQEENSCKAEKYTIVGNTCMEHDVLIQKHEGELKVGDFIIFENRGGYSNVYTPNFIMPSPPIIDTNGVFYKRRDDVESILEVYNYKNKRKK
ncbi:MAG: hypothetical protein IE909_13825, partial [Campylobacterales bacterium]|nr:hypothetical protein [Campylobacterales bacterium]